MNMQRAFHVCVQFPDRASGIIVFRDFTIEQEKRLDGSISIPQLKEEVGRRLRSEGIRENFAVMNIQPLDRDLASQRTCDKQLCFHYLISGYYCNRTSWCLFDTTFQLTDIIKTVIDIRDVRELVTERVESKTGIKVTRPVALLSFILTEIEEG